MLQALKTRITRPPSQNWLLKTTQSRSLRKTVQIPRLRLHSTDRTSPSQSDIVYVTASCIDNRAPDMSVWKAICENNGLPFEASRSHAHRTPGPTFQDASTTYGIAQEYGEATKARIVSHTDCKKFPNPLEGAIQHLIDFHKSPLLDANGGKYTEAVAYLYDIHKPPGQELAKKIYIEPGKNGLPPTLCIQDLENNLDTKRIEKHLIPPDFEYTKQNSDGSQNKQDSYGWKETVRNLSVALKDFAVFTVVAAQIAYYHQIQKNRTGEADIEALEAKILDRLEKQLGERPLNGPAPTLVTPPPPPLEKATASAPTEPSSYEKPTGKGTSIDDTTRPQTKTR